MVEIKSEVLIFKGRQIQFSHESRACDCEMVASIFLPPQAEHSPVPVLYFLSGLTCTDQNFVTKAGAQRVASELGMAIVAPDTSPRGVDLPGEDEDWDFGSGAGFYLNATREPWSKHYRMYDYVVSELPELIEREFPIAPSRRAVTGHSMGGHGALIAALKNPGRYRSVSAFAPICAPSHCPWGEKAFSGYLGEDRSQWADWDAAALIEAGASAPGTILVDQGSADGFLEGQLEPERLQAACENSDGRAPLEYRLQPGYDHSYYFIASFIEDHLRFHHNSLMGA